MEGSSNLIDISSVRFSKFHYFAIIHIFGIEVINTIITRNNFKNKLEW